MEERPPRENVRKHDMKVRANMRRQHREQWREQQRMCMGTEKEIVRA